jgi:hypothetical protein
MVMISAARSSGGVVAGVHQLLFWLSTLNSELSTLLTTSGGLISTTIFGHPSGELYFS